MPSAVTLRTDFLASELRRQAKRSKDNNQSRRLLSLDGRDELHGRGPDQWHGSSDPARLSSSLQ